MDASHTLVLVLAGILAMAGTHHVLIHLRNAGMRAHLWPGGMALAAAAFAVVDGVAATGSPTPAPGLVASMCIAVVAVLVATWRLAGAAPGGRLAGQRQQQALVHASRLSLVGELTASIAHEINQPLGAILGNADAAGILLEGSRPPLDEIRSIVADIQRDGLRASGVVAHVRTLVGQRDMASEQVDADALARDVVALLEPEARRRGVVIGSDLRGTGACFRGDRAHVEQVLVNLVLNALDATEMAASGDGSCSGRPVEVGVALTARGDVRFTVVDSGDGIPAAQLPHLFTAFHSSKPQGMGLGLSISRSIVEAHGGRIEAGNTPGAGARFSVTLPGCGHPVSAGCGRSGTPGFRHMSPVERDGRDHVRAQGRPLQTDPGPSPVQAGATCS